MKEVFGAAPVGWLLPEGFEELEVCGVVGSLELMPSAAPSGRLAISSDTWAVS